MRLILAFTASVICLITSFSQTNETTSVPKNYLGELDGQHFYYTGLSHVRTNKIILYQIEDENVVQKETITLQYDRFEQIFLFEGRLYGLLSDLEEKTYSLVRFDKFFKEEKRIEIMPYKDNPQNLGQKVFSVPVNQITKVIYHPGKVLFYVSFNYVRIAVIDLQSMKAAAYDFDAPVATSFEPSDALFFNETDAHVAFEYWGPSIQFRRYYATFVNGKSNAFRLNDYAQKDHAGAQASSFKFIHANDKDFLVSTAYKNGFNAKHLGFTLTEIKDINITELKMNVIVNDKLNDPTLWSKKNYRKWKRNAHGNLYRNSKLDEVDYIDGQLITCIRHDPQENTMSNLFITSINIDDPTNPTINWNVATHNGLYNSAIHLYNQNAYSYVLAQYPGHLRLFYNCKSSTIAPDGTVKKLKKEPNPTLILKSVESDIAIMDIDLTDGTSRFISNPHRNDPAYPKRIRSPFHYIFEGDIYFILESFKYPTYKEDGSYTPKAIVFPIE